MAKHHPDLIMCRKQPGIAIGRLCEKCDGKCVICDSYVRYVPPRSHRDRGKRARTLGAGVPLARACRAHLGAEAQTCARAEAVVAHGPRRWRAGPVPAPALCAAVRGRACGTDRKPMPALHAPTRPPRRCTPTTLADPAARAPWCGSAMSATTGHMRGAA
jgi:hypothetical protein